MAVGVSAVESSVAQRRRRRALWRLPFLARLIAKPPKLPNIDEPLPLDPRLVVGTLPCGLQYIVGVNRKPRQRAVLRLVVRVGSLEEDDDQSGVAHLIEHMVFRGTPSFPHGDLRKFVESCGMTWGADLNAETSMEYTTFSFEVPLKGTTKLLKTGLGVMKEFASEALMRNEDMTLERAVVEEEWRARLGVEQRMEDRFWAEVFGNSRHSQRLPIGKMEVFQACTADRVRAFYHKWYRLGRMSLICIGDFADNNVAVDLLREVFSTIPAAAEQLPPTLRPNLAATPRASVIYSDVELTSCQVRLRIFSDDSPRQTPRDIVNEMARDLIMLTLNRRFVAMQGREKPPFVVAAASEEHLAEGFRCVVLTATALEGGISKAADALASQAAGLAFHGISEQERALAAKVHMAALDSSWTERHHVETDDMVESAEEYALTLGRAQLSSETTDLRLQRWALEHVVAASSPDGHCLQPHASALFNLWPGQWAVEAEILQLPGSEAEIDEEALRGTVLNAEQAEAPPAFVWEEGEMLDPGEAEACADEMDLEDNGCQGGVQEEGEAEQFSVRHWVLKNGATVTWKRTDFEPDEIVFRGTAVGGSSKFDSTVERAAASTLSGMRMLCGLGKLSKSQLVELLADKNAYTSFSIAGYSRSLAGNCGASHKDFEAALRLASWHFQPPNFTQKSFEKILESTRQRIAHRERDPDHHFHKKLRELTCGPDPFFQEISTSDIDGLEKFGLQGLCRMYESFFSNPGEWSWTIVGALPEDNVLHELLGKYLGPVVSRAEVTAHLLVPRLPTFTRGARAHVYRGVADMATVTFCFAVSYAVTLSGATRLAAQCAAEVLEARLIEHLREVAGATYSVSAGVSPGSFELRRPDRRPSASVNFACEPHAAERCTALVLEEVRALAGGARPVSSEELESCREKQWERMRVNLRENSYWLGRLELAVRRVRCGSADDGVADEAAIELQQLCPDLRLPQLNTALAQVALREGDIEAISCEGLQRAAEDIFREDSMLIVTLLPEKFEEGSGNRTPALAPASGDDAGVEAKRQRVD